MDLSKIHSLASEPEYRSVDEFVSFCNEDERNTYTHVELRALALNARVSASKVREILAGHGLALALRKPSRAVRGFSANSHDRWYGPGSSPTHGGSGYEQINGFAGNRG